MKVNKISASMFILFLVLLFSCNKNLEESTKKMKATVNLEGIWQYTYFEDNDTIITNIEELPFIKFEGQTFVVSKNEKISIDIINFRVKEIFKIERNQKTIDCDVVLISDGVNVFALQKGDKILIKNNYKKVNLVELEKEYFLSSLKNKFYRK